MKDFTTEQEFFVGFERILKRELDSGLGRAYTLNRDEDQLERWLRSKKRKLTPDEMEEVEELLEGFAYERKKLKQDYSCFFRLLGEHS